MAAITSDTESWNGHSFSEVETHLKDRLSNFEANGHAYVEIGGVKWATMNIGAKEFYEKGLYFQWGDTHGYTADQVIPYPDMPGQVIPDPDMPGQVGKYFGWEDYKFGNGTSSPGTTGMTKYNSTDGKIVLDIGDDAARFYWGGGWRMPTMNEYSALANAVNTTWANNYKGMSVSGLVCTDKTDSSKVLFFPACGRCDNGDVINVNSEGYYWSSSISSAGVQRAYLLYFYNGYVDYQDFYYRSGGFPVRGVLG